MIIAAAYGMQFFIGIELGDRAPIYNDQSLPVSILRIAATILPW